MKVLKVALSFVISCLLLVACGKKEEPGKASPPEAAASQPAAPAASVPQFSDIDSQAKLESEGRVLDWKEESVRDKKYQVADIKVTDELIEKLQHQKQFKDFDPEKNCFQFVRRNPKDEVKEVVINGETCKKVAETGKVAGIRIPLVIALEEKMQNKTDDQKASTTRTVFLHANNSNGKPVRIGEIRLSPSSDIEKDNAPEMVAAVLESDELWGAQLVKFCTDEYEGKCEIALHEARITALSAEASELDARFAKVKKEAASALKTADHQKASLDNVNKTLGEVEDEMRGELTKKEAEVSDLKKRMDVLKRTNQEREDRNKALDEELAKSKESGKKSAEELEELRAMNLDLKNKLKEVQTDQTAFRELEKKYALLERELAELRKHLHEVKELGKAIQVKAGSAEEEAKPQIEEKKENREKDVKETDSRENRKSDQSPEEVPRNL